MFFNEDREGIVALEIGTTKVVAAVGEIYKDGRFALHAISEKPSSQIRKGEIMDLEAARQCVQQTLSELEAKAGVTVEKLYLALSGAHTRSLNLKFSVPVENEEGTVTQEEIDELQRMAHSHPIPEDHVIIEAIHQHYYLDDGHVVSNPLGLAARQLTADYHLVHGLGARWTTMIRCVKDLEIEVIGYVLSSYATAQGVLSSADKQLGAVVINLGGGLTDYLAYHRGAVVHSGVLGVGGEHVTQDISLGLNLLYQEAENLKVQEGSLTLEHGREEETIVLPQTYTSKERMIYRESLVTIMQARLEETLQIVKADLEAQPFWSGFTGKIFFTGGASKVRGLREVARAVFGAHEVAIGDSTTVEGSQEAAHRPELATVLGLLRYARKNELERPRVRGFARMGRAMRDALIRFGLM
jgi:cell division protein FtsA